MDLKPIFRFEEMLGWIDVNEQMMGLNTKLKIGGCSKGSPRCPNHGRQKGQKQDHFLQALSAHKKQS
jgi:hypothetical protein